MAYERIMRRKNGGNKGQAGTERFDVVCDNCQEAEESVKCGTFPVFMDKIKALGWKIVPMTDRWRFFCTSCK